MNQLFLDTEFTGLTQDAELISLALVSDDGREFYAQLSDFNASLLSTWHRENVMPHLLPGDLLNRDNAGQVWLSGSAETVRARLQAWFSGFEAIEIWADVLAWDWVLFCELFGGAFGIPKNICHIPFDLSMPQYTNEMCITNQMAQKSQMQKILTQEIVFTLSA